MYAELEVCGGVPPLLRGSTSIFKPILASSFNFGELSKMGGDGKFIKLDQWNGTGSTYVDL